MNPPQPPKAEKPDNHLTVLLKTANGDGEERFNKNNKVRVVLERAIERFKLNPTPASPYKVIREQTGTELNLDTKLEDYEIADGEAIIIRATRPTDG